MSFTTPVDGFVPATGLEGTLAFYNAVRDAPIDPQLPGLMTETNALVTDALALNRTYATQAISDARAVMALLSAASFPDELPDPPAEPVIVTSFASASIGLPFDALPSLGSLSPEVLAPFSPTAVTVPDLDSEIPDYVPLITGLSIPLPPTYVPPSEPTEPGIDYTFDLPDAPEKDYGGPPDLEAFVMPTYTPVVLPVFNDDAPTFSTLPPDPFIVWTEPAYTSTMKDAVQGVIEEMLAGGTGLPDDVSTAIWERARQREDVAASGVIDAAIVAWTARGFATPGGPVDGRMIAVREETERKINELSRERAIADADLEQKNRQFAVEKALDYERIFTAIFLAVVERNFQIAKFHVETAIQVYNMQVTAFNVEQAVFGQKLALFKAQLEAALVTLKVFESLVEVEKAKSEINTARIQLYGEKVKAYGQQVEAYKALIESATARADLQKNKVEIYKAQIDAMIGKINGERTKFEAYDSQVKGEVAKVGLEEANARVYGTRVQAIGVVADIAVKEAQIGIEANKQSLEYNIANMQRVTSYNGMQLNQIQANLAAFQAITSRASAKYAADKSAEEAKLQAQVSLSSIAIAKYQALLEQWKTRSQEIIQFANIQAESLRAAGSMASNLASGAMAGTHVSAGVSASSQASKQESLNSSHQTSQSQTLQESNQYAIQHIHQYRHTAE